MAGICYRTTGHRKKKDATNASAEGYNIGSVRQLATRVDAREGRKEPDAAKERILRRRIKDEREATIRRQDESSEEEGTTIQPSHARVAT